MDSAIGLYLLAFLVFVVSILEGNLGKKGKYPPGPRFALPFVGHLPQLGKKQHLVFKRWRKIYGPVFSYKMGSQNAVVISDAKLAKEVFSKMSTAGRIQSPVFDLISGQHIGIVNSEGKSWEDQRRFTMRTLKDLGIARGVIEEIILYEAKNLIKFFENRVGTPIQGRRIFNSIIFNSLWTLVSGERIEVDASGNVLKEPIYVKWAGDFVNGLNKTVSSGLTTVPWLRHIIPEYTGWNLLTTAKSELDKAANATVNERTTPDSPSGASNFIEHFLCQIETTSNPSSCFYKDTGRKNMIAAMSEFFLAGSETTATTLEFILLYLTQFPLVQAEVQRELDRVVGNSRTPCINDKPSLPYTEAMIMEVMRHATLAPTGLPHRTLEDVEVGGYLIPKDTVLIIDIHNIHHDLDTWGPDAHDFRPERFLNEDKTQVVRHEALMPFSTGRRQCIGEGYAKDSMFLNASCLMQRFSVECADGKVDVEDVEAGILQVPKPFRVIFKLRNN